MTAKLVRPRWLALRDVDRALNHYLQEAGPPIALEFVDALESAFASIGSQPAAGSLRYSHEVGLPDLRFRKTKRFPFLIFYVERTDFIEVWRVLHGRRDIPAQFAEAEA